jgi:prepilin-type N-terminal cleavage/methylation domain-containing protein
MREGLHNQRGFTLVEIMMVVIIIGILAVLAIPRYEKYTIESKLSEVAVSVGEIKTGMEKYYNSHGNRYRDVTFSGRNTWLEQVLRVDLGQQNNFLFAVSSGTRVVAGEPTYVGYLIRARLSTSGKSDSYNSNDIGDEVVFYFPKQLNSSWTKDEWVKGWNDDDFFTPGQTAGKYTGN